MFFYDYKPSIHNKWTQKLQAFQMEIKDRKKY